MKVGDLVWYNSAGSSRTAIILDFAKNNWLDHRVKTEMVKVFWTGGEGPMPAMYGRFGERIYNHDAHTCFVRAKTHMGFNMFKVISSV